MGTSNGECLAYIPPQKAKLNGVINKLITVVIAVRLTDKGTFAFDMEEIRLDTFPPGQAATNIIPSATDVLGLIIITNRNVSAGRRIYCAMTPSNTGLGRKSTLLKWYGLILNATPNMMKAMATFMRVMLSWLKFNRTLLSCSRFPKRDNKGADCICDFFDFKNAKIQLK
jgi:hypothetical protein